MLRQVNFQRISEFRKLEWNTEKNRVCQGKNKWKITFKVSKPEGREGWNWIFGYNLFQMAMFKNFNVIL